MKTTLLAAALIAVLISSATAQDNDPQPSATQTNGCAANKAVVRKLFDEWINKKNLAAIDEMVTQTYVSHEGGEHNAEDTKKGLAGS